MRRASARRAPRARQLSVIAAAKRPEEMLVIVRTSSIGTAVPPPVTSTFMNRTHLSWLLHDRGMLG